MGIEKGILAEFFRNPHAVIRTSEPEEQNMELIHTELRSAARPYAGVHRISPSLIDSTNLRTGLFGEANMETGAERIIRLLQKGDVWRAFLPSEFGPTGTLYELRLLLDYGWVALASGEPFHPREKHPYGVDPAEPLAVTERFIERCAKRLKK
jgi:hypothetical protein